ncbi:hypothetical protein BU14_0672s0001 [Porphyra umbilicalis]|uniref:Uncharacterized protein n=1 Tax=Porphyra umbilicalis TaxID=2786 RepID=A0A1X6NQ87_PORUM|nr:hypothetical protein BU14_0672s0001 [Porphyra umbilicalis]|eukprot:OSX70761.1 hypothetical protein BU14_0672s0001 [Porphyra umbilicalis]
MRRRGGFVRRARCSRPSAAGACRRPPRRSRRSMSVGVGSPTCMRRRKTRASRSSCSRSTTGGMWGRWRRRSKPRRPLARSLFVRTARPTAPWRRGRTRCGASSTLSSRPTTCTRCAATTGRCA